METPTNKDAYFIRLTNNKKAFVHPTPNELHYVVKETFVGAAIWQRDKGENFIRESKADNLELVPINEIINIKIANNEVN